MDEEIQGTDETQYGKKQVIPGDAWLLQFLVERCDEEKERQEQGDEKVIIGVPYHNPEKLKMKKLIDRNENADQSKEDEYPPQWAGKGPKSLNRGGLRFVFYAVHRTMHIILFSDSLPT